MGESVFEVVKQSVTAREAAELYGIAVGRGGMACCPFHDDRHPSMKVDTRFHCFGCGADGDVIDFTARLYDLSPKEAAEKLARILAWLTTARPRSGETMSGRNPRHKNLRRTGTVPSVPWLTTIICLENGRSTILPKCQRKIHIPGSWRQSREGTM